MSKEKSLLARLKKVVLADDQIELAEFTLEDGTVIIAESLEAGEAVYTMDGEERKPLPAGDYLLSDGTTLVVSEDGVVGEIMAKAEEAETLSEEDVTKIEKKVTDQAAEIEELKAANEKSKANLKVAASSQKGINFSPEGKGKKSQLMTLADARRMSVSERIHNAMLQTGYYNNVNLATTTSITSTYAGEFAGDYIRAATLQGATLGARAITVKENIKYKLPVKRVVTAGILADASCDFTDTGTVDIDERILTPKELQSNLVLCKDDFQVDWDAVSMGYSAFDVLPPTFQAFFVEQMAAIVNEAVEQSIWQGIEVTAGQFGGFGEKFAADGTVIDITSTTVDSSNVIAEMEKVFNAIPNSIRGTADLTMYVSNNVYSAYTVALGGFGASGLGAAGINGQGPTAAAPLFYAGIPVFVAPGLADNQMVAAQARNLWYGTGLLNDNNQVKVLDMADLDGSQNVRFVMRFTGGTQYGFGAEIVYYWLNA